MMRHPSGAFFHLWARGPAARRTAGAVGCSPSRLRRFQWELVLAVTEGSCCCQPPPRTR